MRIHSIEYGVSDGFERVAMGHLDVTEAQQLLIRIGSAAARGLIDQARRDERLLFLRTLRACATGVRDSRKIAAIAIQAAYLVFDRGDV